MEVALQDVLHGNVLAGLVAEMAKGIQTSPGAASGSAFPPRRIKPGLKLFQVQMSIVYTLNLNVLRPAENMTFYFHYS